VSYHHEPDGTERVTLDKAIGRRLFEDERPIRSILIGHDHFAVETYAPDGKGYVVHYDLIPLNGTLCVFPERPQTERVSLYRTIGRRLASHPDKVVTSVNIAGHYPQVTIQTQLAAPNPDETPEAYMNWWATRETVALALGKDETVVVLVEYPDRNNDQEVTP
jgi:hypothetical protein